MLELLNFMTADGGAENLAEGRAVDGPARRRSLADPDGPLLRTLDQLPGLTGELRQSLAAGAGAGRPEADQALASVDGLVGGAKSPVAQTLAELRGDPGRHPQAQPSS